MTHLANFRPRIIPDTITLIVRELPGDGPILAQVGQEVSPADVLGLSVVTAGFRMVNFAKVIEANPKDGVKFLQKEIGKAIFRGEILGLKKGIFKKTFISPIDGVLESYDPKTGDLKLSYLPERQRISASVFGIVTRVDRSRRRIVIKTEATQILGLLGCGRVREGNLAFLGTGGSLTDVSRITPRLTDHIVIAGGLVYKEALRAAVAISVKGVLTGGINAEDFKSMSGGSLTGMRSFGTDVGLSLIVTEGFGTIPIGKDIFSVLLKYNDKFAVIDGHRARLLLPSFYQNCLQKIRTTALPEHQEMVLLRPTVEPVAEELKLGFNLRVVASPFLGAQGKLIGIDSTATKLPSGLQAYLLTIETKSRKIKVPLPNVELI